jgi:hypothetical protein
MARRDTPTCWSIQLHTSTQVPRVLSLLLLLLLSLLLYSYVATTGGTS